MSLLKSKNIAILGGGIIGLTTAHSLLELVDLYSKPAKAKLNITILSDSFGKDTTSDGAGGLFRPDDRFIPGVPKPLVKQWATESFKYFDKLLFSPEGGKAGIFQASGYQMFDDERQDPSYKEYVYQFRKLTQDELNTFPRKFKYGYFSTTMAIDCRTHMAYLTEILTQRGVKFVQKKVGKMQSFVEESNYDIVFNCLGFGSIEFCDDKLMTPIRGQMIRVHAPWIKHFYYTDDNCYIIPNINNICLGGTRQKGDFNTDLDVEDSKKILDRCKELCPSLETAKIEWEWVGLRPHREPIRVEKEILAKKNGSKVIMVHNYGHGGNGIALSRGTVNHALRLLLQELDPQSFVKSNL